MSLKRLFGGVLLIAVCSLGWFGYRAAHRSALDHDLILASAAGNPKTVRTLLQQGADPNTREDSSLQTAWQRLLHLFSQDRPAYVCPLSQALIFDAPDANRVETVRLLLEHKADPNLKLPGGVPLPIRAIQMLGDGQVPNLFLQYGADPNTIDEDGDSRSSMLMYAIHLQRWSLVQPLLEHGAKPNLTNIAGDSALMWAAYQQDPETLKLLLAHGADVKQKNNRGQSALTYALARQGLLQRATLESLLAAGADVNAPDLQQYTPFLFALLIHSPSVGAMLAKGGDARKSIPLAAPTASLYVDMRLEHASTLVNIAPAATPGTTPLMFAVRAHNVGLVRAMLAKGADVNAQDVKGKTAFDAAEQNPEIRALLQQAAARH